MKKLIVSVAQICCIDGEVDKNLAHASDFVIEAHERKTELLLFPEFMSQGYRLTEEIWNSAESFDGPTTNWLCSSARKYNMYIGSSFLEARNGHFLNTFALAEPSGKIAGVVRKQFPSMWEAYFFKGVNGDHVIDTELGRVGVGICFDNHTFKVASLISKGKPEIVLMPHSYCTPTVPQKLVTLNDIDRLKSLPVKVARLYHEFLGVPVILSNKSGSWDSPVPNKMFGTPENFRFSGRSTIIDSNGATLAELGDDEAIGTGELSLIPDFQRNRIIPKYSRYIYPGPKGREIIKLMELKGYLKYTFNNRRKSKALSV